MLAGFGFTRGTHLIIGGWVGRWQTAGLHEWMVGWMGVFTAGVFMLLVFLVVLGSVRIGSCMVFYFGGMEWVGLENGMVRMEWMCVWNWIGWKGWMR